MKLAIVGSQHLTDDESRRVIRDVLARYQPVLVISGDAPGIDTLAVEEAAALGIATEIHRPKVQLWRDGFMPRNMLIAQRCDALVRITFKCARTYGSGWTRDYAKQLGKPTEEIVL